MMRTTARPRPLSGMKSVIQVRSLNAADSTFSMSASRASASGTPHPMPPASEPCVSRSRTAGKSTRTESRQSATRPSACRSSSGGDSMSAERRCTMTLPSPEPVANRDRPSTTSMPAYCVRRSGSEGRESSRATVTRPCASSSESSVTVHGLPGLSGAGTAVVSANNSPMFQLLSSRCAR